MRKFEYVVRSRLNETDLNKYGKEGWELIHIQRDNSTHKHWFYFKKEIL